MRGVSKLSNLNNVLDMAKKSSVGKDFVSKVVGGICHIFLATISRRKRKVINNDEEYCFLGYRVYDFR